MPNQPKTRARSIRIPEDVWQPASAIADADGVTMSDVVREALSAPELPPHSCQHTFYRMSCDEFDALMVRAEGRCELCHQPHSRLSIDHDHAIGWHAVRGIVCPKCNAHLRRIDSGERTPDAAVGAYLALAWHVGRPVPKPSLGMKDKAIITTVRVDDELWEAFKATAARKGLSASAVLIRYMRHYVKSHQ